MNIPNDNNYTNYTFVNMDETSCSLEMWLEATIDFKGKNNVELLTSGRESYRISY